MENHNSLVIRLKLPRRKTENLNPKEGKEMLQKVVFSVTKAGKSESKLKGVGYIDGTSLYIPAISKNGNAYIRVFEDCIKSKVETEYSGVHTEYHKIQLEVLNGQHSGSTSYEEKEVLVTYFIWFKLI